MCPFIISKIPDIANRVTLTTIINKKSGVPNARFLMLIFCQFLDHESKTIEAKAVEFSKKLQNFIRNQRQKYMDLA